MEYLIRVCDQTSQQLRASSDAAVSIPVRTLPQSGAAFAGSPQRPGELAPARAWGRKSGVACRHGSAPGTPTGATRRWRNGSWVCRTCWNAPKGCREGTPGRRPVAQCGSKNLARQQRVWRGSRARSYLDIDIVQDNRGKQEQNRNANLLSSRFKRKTAMKSNALAKWKTWLRNRWVHPPGAFILVKRANTVHLRTPLRETGQTP